MGWPKLVGQSLSALGTSSLENVATIRGLHSLSEAMLLLSLTLLRLVSSEHFGYLLQDLLSGRNSAGLTGAEILYECTERTTLTVILYPQSFNLSIDFIFNRIYPIKKSIKANNFMYYIVKLEHIVKYYSLQSQCEIKFAHIRVSEYFTFAEQIFHSKAISLARRANFVEKSHSQKRMAFFWWRQ